MTDSATTPKSLGYRMPAEWSRHSGTLLSWPANRETWPGERLNRVEKVYADIVETLSRFEPVHLLIPDSTTEVRMRRALKDRTINAANLILHRIPTNDVWVRDCGPIMLKRTGTVHEFQAGKKMTGTHQGSIAGTGTHGGSAGTSEDSPASAGVIMTDWGYNAWGGKYPPYDDDNRIPEYFGAKYGIPRVDPGIILEGGSVETDGEGTLITTKSVLLNPNRNPGLSAEKIEWYLKEYLGMDRVIWLGDGLAGDDTDGHIDDLTRFLNTNTLMTMVSEKTGDVNYRALSENLEQLRDLRRHDGSRYEIIPVHLPETRIEGTTVDGSEYVPASYANFYIANDVVILPVYDKKYDGGVIEMMQHYFPDRHIAAIPSADLVWGQGSVHCITQQLYGI
jgi:agmatine deiminase